MNFFTSLSTGHSGTKWLSQVLNTSENVKCFHELKLEAHKSYLKGRFSKRLWKYSWKYDYENRLTPISHCNDYLKYLSLLTCDQCKYLGDLQSWGPADLNLCLKNPHVIHLVRNGIQVVHSLYQTNRNMDYKDKFFTQYLKRHFDMIDTRYPYSFDTFYYWCAYWRLVNLEAVDRWKHNLQSYRLEDLLEDPNLLQASFPDETFSPVEEQNRKVKGNRDPEYLWSLWDPSERSIFRHLCEEPMKEFGYEIPS